ncbi:MAG: hypothetical protein SNJ74_02430 [Fimbriimonadaceae bacterium]
MSKPMGLFYFIAFGIGLLFGPVLYSSLRAGGISANAAHILGILCFLSAAAVVFRRNRVAAVRTAQIGAGWAFVFGLLVDDLALSARSAIVAWLLTEFFHPKLQESDSRTGSRAAEGACLR